MWKSKFFTVMIALSFLAVCAILVFQTIEMKDYGMLQRFFESL